MSFEKTLVRKREKITSATSQNKSVDITDSYKSVFLFGCKKRKGNYLLLDPKYSKTLGNDIRFDPE